jgi:hypothetical protein
VFDGPVALHALTTLTVAPIAPYDTMIVTQTGVYGDRTPPPAIKDRNPA